MPQPSINSFAPTRTDLHGHTILMDYDDAGEQRFRVCPEGQPHKPFIELSHYGTAIKVAKAILAIDDAIGSSENVILVSGVLRDQVNYAEKLSVARVHSGENKPNIEREVVTNAEIAATNG